MNLSIITVNLNNLVGLKRTAHSLINQSFQNYEWILVDGNSVDGSKSFIKECATGSKFPSELQKNIKYISEPDNGIYDAMNKGIRMATGEYCLFLNSGDWLTHDNVLKDVFAHNPSADVVAGDIYFYDTQNKEIKWHVPSPDELTAKTLFWGTLSHQSTLIKRKLFEELGLYNEELKIESDWLFFIEALLENKFTYQHIPVTLSYFAMDGISCNPETNNLPRREQLMILKQKYPRFIDDYERLKQLEEEDKRWKSSREYIVFRWLQKIGIVSLGKLFVKTNNFFKRKIILK